MTMTPYLRAQDLVHWPLLTTNTVTFAMPLMVSAVGRYRGNHSTELGFADVQYYIGSAVLSC